METKHIKGLPAEEYFQKWRDNHKDSTQEYNKQWYILHKETHIKKMLESVTCECGFITAKSNLIRHQKTKLHLKKLKLSTL